MPYRLSAFGVLPPLWSSAAMKPLADLTISYCCGFMAIAVRCARWSVRKPGTLEDAPHERRCVGLAFIDLRIKLKKGLRTPASCGTQRHHGRMAPPQFLQMGHCCFPL